MQLMHIFYILMINNVFTNPRKIKKSHIWRMGGGSGNGYSSLSNDSYETLSRKAWHDGRSKFGAASNWKTYTTGTWYKAVFSHSQRWRVSYQWNSGQYLVRNWVSSQCVLCYWWCPYWDYWAHMKVCEVQCLKVTFLQYSSWLKTCFILLPFEVGHSIYCHFPPFFVQAWT